MSAVKSKIQPHDKVAALLRVGADPNSMGPATNPPSSAPSPFASPASASTASVQYPPLTLATRKRDYRPRKSLRAAVGVGPCLESHHETAVSTWCGKDVGVCAERGAGQGSGSMAAQSVRAQKVAWQSASRKPEGSIGSMASIWKRLVPARLRL